jgi:hypothetical protein
MKITKLVLLSLGVIFLSCSDDEAPLPTSQGMVGTWTMTAVDYTGTSTTTMQGVSYKADYTGTGKDMTVTTAFTENPNTVNTEGSYIIVLKTTVMGQSTTQDVPFDEVVVDGTWTLDGRTLTITGDVGPQTATVLEQTSTSLKIRMDVKESVTSQDITVSTDIQITYIFKKN